MKNMAGKAQAADRIFFSVHIEQLELSGWQVVLAILRTPIHS
jgi:hypothetical protein